MIRYLLLLLVVIGVSSCVLPPSSDVKGVLAPEELDLISQINLGHEFVAGGSFDRAEVIFRQALRKRSDISSIHNDLGFALLQQDRLEEAEVSLKKALQLDRYNISALDSLATVFFRLGQYEKSANALQLELDSIYRLRGSERIKRLGTELKGRDFAIIFRNLSSAYLAAGQFDEAICNSQLAITVDVGDYQASQHSRLLMGLGYLGKAEETIQYYVGARGEDVTPSMLLDLSAIDFETTRYQLAYDNAQRYINTGKAGIVDQLTAQLVKLAAMSHGVESPDSKDEIIRQIVSSETKLCLKKQPDNLELWPSGVRAAINEQLAIACKDG